MEVQSLLQNLIKSDPQNIKSLQLKTGQIIKGQVLELINEQLAVVSIRGIRLIAKNEVPLKKGQKAWFMVTARDHEITKLKLIHISNPTNPKDHSLPIDDLLKTLQLKNSSQNRNLIFSLIEKQIPVKKETILAIEQYLQKTKENMTDVIHAVDILNDLDLPITASHIRSLVEFFDGQDLPKRLSILRQQIKNEIKHFQDQRGIFEDTSTSLKEIVEQIDDVLRSYSFPNEKIEGKDLLLSIKKYLEYIGANSNSYPTLKQHLQSLLGMKDKLPDPLTSTLESLVFHLHGQQLTLQPDTNHFTHLFLQFPNFIRFSEEPIYVQIHSKKKGNQTIDMNDVRLVFLFQFPNLGDTIIHIHLLQRQMIVWLYNDHPSIHEIIKTIGSRFEEFIKREGYKTSGIQIRSLKELKGKESFLSSPTPYQGVDLRI
ncbi:hypothetical protein [Tepidibacillus sp. LV47]|uniref:hypothetical protein n=1 Tax=Tepidibacillus sp. LV47 TaxID=3398228 RepID=UPI003AAD3390